MNASEAGRLGGRRSTFQRRQEVLRQQAFDGLPLPLDGCIELFSRDRLIARRCGELKGQDAVLLLAERAEPMHPDLSGPTRVQLSYSPPSEGVPFAWASIGNVYYAFLLSRIQGVFSPEEAELCGVGA